MVAAIEDVNAVLAVDPAEATSVRRQPSGSFAQFSTTR
jgi:hypothetical protein